MELTADLFSQFFAEVNRCKTPFPWQEDVAAQACTGNWPSPIALPTAAGKTALIDIAVFALACAGSAAPRRIFFVVDRRVIVDEAADRAQKLSDQLRTAQPGTVAELVARRLRSLAGEADPLAVATLRGGLPNKDDWARSPAQPLVCCSTVDQVGSSLLFRSYGARSEYTWPIRAALTGNDALMILDEAHISGPFAETVARIRTYNSERWAEQPPCGRLVLVELSATPDRAPAVVESERDRNHPVLKARWGAEKPARLIVAETIEGDDARSGHLDGLVRQMASEAVRVSEAGAKVIGVIANRVGTARAIFDRLKDRNPILFTGRMRPHDRDLLWSRWRGSIELGRKDPPEPVFVIATQCVEVGANLDFDALITEVASIDALEQRFGRLNRDGRPYPAQAAIVAQKDQTSSRYVDWLYGEALAHTWAWLNQHAKTVQRLVPQSEGERSKKPRKVKELVIDMGVNSLRAELRKTEDPSILVMPRQHAPVLMPAHMDRLAQTSPVPEPSPEVALFLHGPASGPADIEVVWRADLGANESQWLDTVAVCPPSPLEAVSVPIWHVRRWLNDKPAAQLGDTEGAPADEARAEGGGRRVVWWRGPDESAVVSPGEIRPGTTIIVPASYGGCDAGGYWNPAAEDPVRDIGDEVRAVAGRARTLRLDAILTQAWADTDEDRVRTEEIAQALRQAEDQAAVRDWLKTLANEAAAREWVRLAAAALASDRRLKLVRDYSGDEPRIIAACGSAAEVFQDSSAASRTVEIRLADHLAGCAAIAADYARSAGLPERAAATVALAAKLHDIGKADPRFQTWLCGGVPAAAIDPLAKSATNWRDRAALRRAREQSGYPEGARHELQSVALLRDHSLTDGGDIDEDLLLHLIASHHGRCRPFAPVVTDPKPVTVRYSEWAASSQHGLGSVGSGVSERYWRLTRRYGWYGLALLETIVRLADHRQSEEEQDRDAQRASAAAQSN